MKSKSIFQFALIILVFVLSVLLLRNCKKVDLLEQQKKAIADTTKIFRNKSNQLVAEKLAFVGEKKALLSEIERWKIFGDTLQNKLTNKTNQIILLKREITIANSGEIKPPKGDTIYIANIVIDTPTISIDTGDAFHRFKFASNKSKYAYEFKVFDNSELKVEYNGKKGTRVTLLNTNPYVDKVDIKSVMIAPKKNSLISKVVYVGLGLGIGYLIFK